MNETFLYKRQPFKPDNLNVWIAYPGIYNFGMSALGFLTVFEMMDKNENVNAERIFVDTKTTQIDVRNVDIFGFSFSFELDFLSIFKILEKFNIPFSSKDRDEKYPLIYAGGPVVTANPEPFAEIFDYIELGDAENKSQKIIETILQKKGCSKKEILEELSKIEGIYVPSLTVFDKQKGMITLDGNNYHVRKSTDMLKDICVTTPILTENSFFKNTYIIEIARGCPQRCGFCNTSFINSPYRTCDENIIISKIEKALQYTHKIAFLGAAIAAHPCFEKFCDYMYEKSNEYSDLELSVSSLRADGVSDKVAQTLVKCGQKHATVALEAGSDRLRRVINKNLTNEKFKQTLLTLKNNGFKGVKIYGMVGLPTESQEDIVALVDFANELKKENKGFDISFGFSSFVPKAHTAFQFVEKENSKSIDKKYEFLKKQMAKSGVKITVSGTKWDYIQALFSRGGRELFDYAVAVYQAGGNIGAFKSEMKDFQKSKKIDDFDKIVYSKRNYDEINPWDFIDMPFDKNFLIKECNRLLSLQ
ncbi:radical SAM protein [bacterium]|nr:radical SAM protein [bacterium]